MGIKEFKNNSFIEINSNTTNFEKDLKKKIGTEENNKKMIIVFINLCTSFCIYYNLFAYNTDKWEVYMQFFFDNQDINGLTECLVYCNQNVISKTKRKVVFLCIGTDKIIGDSFGPIVGHFLKQNKYIVYGDLKNTVNDTNLKKYIEQINEKYKEPYIVVIDSALGNKDMINKIVVGKGGIIPGSALNKKNKKIGDLFINAVVGVNSTQNFEELKKVKLYNVMNLSNTVVQAISKSIGLKNNKIANNYISLERG